MPRLIMMPPCWAHKGNKVGRKKKTGDSFVPKINKTRELSRLSLHSHSASSACRMSTNRLSLVPAGNWRHGNEHGDSSSPDQSTRTSVPWPLYYRQDGGGGMLAPWRLFEERVRTGPYGFTRFPSPPQSPVRILILDSDMMEERVSPRLRQFIQDSPLRTRGEWHLESPALETEEPGLSTEEFNNAMKKLRKQAYNLPPLLKRNTQKKRGLFSNYRSSRDTNNNKVVAESEKVETKVCAVCLETFVANEQVLVTPCNHIFHHDCLVPWVKSSGGQCPVCRFVFYERRRPTASSGGHHQRRVAGGQEEAPGDLIALIRAMEEAFNWVALAH